MIKKVLFLLLLLFFPLLLGASSVELDSKDEVIFKAKVLDILEEVEKETLGGDKIIQQNIKLIGLDNIFQGQEFVFYGIGNIEVIGNRTYSNGDKVLVTAMHNSIDDSFSYYITDYVRSPSLLIMLALFLFCLIIIGRWKGLRSLISLALTFLVIIFFIVPKIMIGFNPILISLIGSIFILLLVIYLTEGFNLRSHLATLSTFISLLLVIGISYFFIYLTRLSGAFSEDVFVLINVGQQVINLKGMLLAGMIIGALGVLDDVIISQVVAVEQIILANPKQNWREVFKKSYKIGISHISSMTNTLFLAYAGASLPLLILFISPDSPFNSLEQIINNEAISTEIVRALSGSLGIILSIPIATFIAIWGFLLRKNKKENY
ncbi:MAG: YibE/F family protein [Patescibacteria group bacterium]|nr:YibE/F family protein [Patescibacteria group bacterium]